MPSLHTKHTHKYTMNMNTGLNQLASLYNKDEEAKNNKQTTTKTNKQCTSQSKTAIQQCMEREEGMSVLLIILLIRSHIVLH